MSRLRAGETIRVRSKEEILSTLDQNGRLEGLPFMPEMFQYCGKTVQVHKRAHKTCDFVTLTGIRKLSNAVHLEGARCDGSAHGGCQAECMFYWKEAWLERVPGDPRQDVATSGRGCSEEDVWSATRVPSQESAANEPVYSCQATLLPQFTQPLSPWDVRAYIEDYRSGNVTSVWSMLPRFLYRFYDNLINLGIGWGPILRWAYDQFQKVIGGRPHPGRGGVIPAGAKTPAVSLNLQPGEVVRVKDFHTILQTVDVYCKNRGMSFGQEMSPYCGGTHKVRSRVEQIIDERSGKMIKMKNSCIILEDVVCQSRYNKRMIFCPRATFAYWREIWLERTE